MKVYRAFVACVIERVDVSSEMQIYIRLLFINIFLNNAPSYCTFLLFICRPDSVNTSTFFHFVFTLCYDLILLLFFCLHFHAAHFQFQFFSITATRLEITTVPILHLHLNVDSPDFFIPLIYFFLTCPSAKKCQMCLCNPHFAMFLFIFCYSLLYLVTICCCLGLIFSLG